MLNSIHLRCPHCQEKLHRPLRGVLIPIRREAEEFNHRGDVLLSALELEIDIRRVSLLIQTGVKLSATLRQDIPLKAVRFLTELQLELSGCRILLRGHLIPLTLKLKGKGILRRLDACELLSIRICLPFRARDIRLIHIPSEGILGILHAHLQFTTGLILPALECLTTVLRLPLQHPLRRLIRAAEVHPFHLEEGRKGIFLRLELPIQHIETDVGESRRSIVPGGDVLLIEKGFSTPPLNTLTGEPCREFTMIC